MWGRPVPFRGTFAPMYAHSEHPLTDHGERLKELSCLYAVARAARGPHNSLRAALEAMLAEVPAGWQWPEKLQAWAVIDGETYGALPIDGHRLRTTLRIGEQERGELNVAYSTTSIPEGRPAFLPEEHHFLDKLGQDMAAAVAEHEKRLHEQMLDHWMLNTDRLTVLSELAAGIAHELNTPLGNMLGYAELLCRSEKDPARKADLQRIIDSALLGREIVKKLMYFSCEMPAAMHPHDINAQVRQALDLLDHRMAGTGVRLDLRLHPAPLMVRLDTVQFTQVMTNLVINALQAMPAGGTLGISSVRSAEHVRIHVVDTGHGIAEEHLPRIFQPFFTTKGTGEGTGLGLAVVHGIMKSHGGRIDVDASPEQGTRFTLTYPAAERP